jgi:hypothetical protein|nr:MAG TPA: hypothetical protein [Caudoviricetes sp.]
MIMVYAIKRGLLLTDFNVMSIGMILDYIDHYDRLHGIKEENGKQANQLDFDTF